MTGPEQSGPEWHPNALRGPDNCPFMSALPLCAERGSAVQWSALLSRRHVYKVRPRVAGASSMSAADNMKSDKLEDGRSGPMNHS